ncbi:cytochrome P450 [Streptomyces iranensis]|uniref:Cytochrome P450 n=1 Tax=Streptomyces iranensis TaxID=576784 RepID=A0A061AC17_9ACTN|nr:cytochrome P450 [Streptomyces iranensis]MBP2064265.1 cytochrome P450 [Streptomyces iranensis]CDR17397.1 cytochrome P450 [Streptomyces iranensis]
MTTSPVADDASAEIPAFPQPRAAVCPFDPSPELRGLASWGPLTRVRSWNDSTPWAVTGHAEQRTLLSDPRLSADFSHPGFPSPVPHTGGERPSTDLSFVGMDDPEHARLRRMVSGAFTIKRVEAMRPVVQEMVDDFITRMLAGPKPADLVQALALPLPSLVISELLGVPYEDHEFFQTNSKVLVSAVATPEERAAAHTNLYGYLDQLVGEKLARPGDDLLSGLAQQITAGELTRREAAAMGVLLLLGGHETTANMITMGTLLLLQHPEQLARVREADDPKVIVSAVEELLRYLSVVHLGRRRTALEDIEIAGRTIRAGEGVILLGELANRDPAVFPDPDRLDIGRDARHHQAFGVGTHHCLGQPLARMELQVVYPTLFRRVPTLRMAADVADIPFKYDAVIYGVYELPVTW